MGPRSHFQKVPGAPEQGQGPRGHGQFAKFCTNPDLMEDFFPNAWLHPYSDASHAVMSYTRGGTTSHHPSAWQTNYSTQPLQCPAPRRPPHRGAGGESAEATSPPPGPSSILPCHDSSWEKPRQGERKHRGHHPPCTLLGTHSLRS